MSECTIVSKINVTIKGVYLPISKLHSILAVANLFATAKIYMSRKTKRAYLWLCSEKRQKKSASKGINSS